MWMHLKPSTKYATTFVRMAFLRTENVAKLHLGRATSVGTSEFLSKLPEHAKSTIRLPGVSSILEISKTGYGSPAPFSKETQVLDDMKEAVLTHHNNMIQTRFFYSPTPDNDDTLGNIGESIAINELISEDKTSREGLVISALLDEEFGQSTITAADRLSKDVLLKHLEKILQVLDVQVLDVLIVRLPEELFSMPTATATALIQEAIAALESEIASSRIQGYGFAFPSTIHQITLKQQQSFASNVLYPQLTSGCVALQLPTNLQEGFPPPGAQVTWIGENPLNIHVSTQGQLKPLQLKSIGSSHSGDEVAAKLKECFTFALNVEQKYSESIYPEAEATTPDLPSPEEVAWAHILAHQHAQFNNLAEWTYIRETQLHPRLELLLERLKNIEATKDFAFAYSVAIRNLLKHFDISIEMLATNENERIAGLIQSLGIQTERIDTSAVHIARNYNIDCVLLAQDIPHGRDVNIPSISRELLTTIQSQSWETTE